jgi:hypothetical protein
MIKFLVASALCVSFATAYAEESHQHVPQSQQEQRGMMMDDQEMQRMMMGNPKFMERMLSMMLMHRDAFRKALENNPQLKRQMEEIVK